MFRGFFVSLPQDSINKDENKEIFGGYFFRFCILVLISHGESNFV